MEAIKTYEHKGYTIEIHYDEWGESPREWDNMGTLVTFSSRYTIGDDHNFTNAGELINFIEDNKDKLYYLPVYMYDHGGIAISTKPYSCPWDSGQIGYIYAEKEKSKEDKLPYPYAALENEVDILNDYLQGRVYGYKIFNDEGEELDSCWGYIGDMGYCEEAAEQVVDYYDRTMPKQYDLFCA